ncbi:MAG TPA: hypothetical protein VLF93_05495 [Candidatus Saccharimonadales bacterium]|nr:hypothetical protein [Candidatus Saccharimonadales bacterium]
MTEPFSENGTTDKDRLPQKAASPPEQRSGGEPTPLQRKQAVWDAKRRELEERIPDLVEGMTETVVAFEMHGINTLASSEGAVDFEHDLLTPWVDIGAPNTLIFTQVGQEETYKRILRERGIPENEIVDQDSKAFSDALKETWNNDSTEAYKQWEGKTDPMAHQLEGLLHAFYQERDISEDLRIQAGQLKNDGRWTVVCGDIAEHFHQEITSTSNRTSEEAATILLARRTEMLAFTEFLRDRYLNASNEETVSPSSEET